MNWFSKRIFLDYASATPVLPEVSRAMEKYWSEEFYNPNAVYSEGERVKSEVHKFRKKIAEILGVVEEAVVFTSGGTEANTWAVQGVGLSAGGGKVVIEPDSHPSLAEAVRESDSDKVVLVSSPVPNNKLGRKIREERKESGSKYPLLHIDASQTANYFRVGLEHLSCDLLTLDSAKLYGPKGIGALVVRRGVEIDLPPQGTPAVPLIAGFAKALEVVSRDREREFARLDKLSRRFVEVVNKSLPDVEIEYEAPNIINISLPDILPEYLVLALDRAGVMVSAGPACLSNKPEPRETPVRFSLGRFTTEKEIEKAAKIFCKVVQNMVK